MNDTSPEIDQRFRDMLLARSGEDRLKMGCSMHAMAQAMVDASLKEKMPDATAGDIRRELFLRFYIEDIGIEAREKIIKALEAQS